MSSHVSDYAHGKTRISFTLAVHILYTGSHGKTAFMQLRSKPTVDGGRLNMKL